MASAALTWLACADDNASPLAPTPVPPNAPAADAAGPVVMPSVPVGGDSSSSLMALGALSDGDIRSAEHLGAGFEGGAAAVAASAVAALNAAPGLSATSGAGVDEGLGVAGPPGFGAQTFPDLLTTSGAGSEYAFDTPSAPISEVGHVPCPVPVTAAVELKSNAPEPIEPKGGERTAAAKPLLAARNAQGTFVSATFGYLFALYKGSGSSRVEVEVGCGVPRDSASTSYQVTTRLDLQESYSWQARAFLDGAYGPWSEPASFRTVAVRLGAPQPLVPGSRATVPFITAFTVGNPTVEGDRQRVFIEIQVATDVSFATNVTTGRSRIGAGGETRITPDRALEPGTSYYWRSRATASTGAGGEVAGPWSDTVMFETSDFALTSPQPISPGNGEVGVPVGPRPRFTVRNATASGDVGTINVQVVVARDAAFEDVVARGETHQRRRGETDVWLSNPLMPETQYHWRVRGRLAADPTVASDWSAVWSFTTGSDSPTTAPGRGDCCPPPNRSDILDAIVARTGSLYRRDVREFTQRVAECLASTDGDWGRRRNDSGALGKDTVAYRTTKGRGSGPFSIDIVRGAAGDNPEPRWGVPSHNGIEGRIGGTWVAVDGSACILGSVSAR